jgi:hypothetical protein
MMWTRGDAELAASAPSRWDRPAKDPKLLTPADYETPAPRATEWKQMLTLIPKLKADR